LVVTRTKSRIARFAAPSFHEGNAPPGAVVCAGAEVESSVPDKAGSPANVESNVRRLTSEKGGLCLMIDLLSDAGRCG
jgi:hypothetical protein